MYYLSLKNEWEPDDGHENALNDYHYVSVCSLKPNLTWLFSFKCPTLLVCL